ncbi:MAG TPA: YeeE/YedE thiosulfate transporter family protein [Casimicrobiaceae bacterium]|nr:YeeE/YedE thiosulfate transporter family protein [Casimicrobiaceae bacterium]
MALAWFVSVRQAALFAVGIGLGVALAGARFGFTTGWRALVVDRDPRGVIGQVVLLALLALASIPLLGAFPELHAALGPPSVSLIVGAFVFGLAMQIADGCGSGTLYKAGLGVPLNAAILPLFALGSFLGSVHLDRWLALGALEPVGFVDRFGAAGALALTFGLLAVAAVAALAWAGRERARRALDRRWVVGAVALAGFAALNLVIAGQPWGVVYGFGLWGAKVAAATGAFDPSANWFWSQPGHAQILGQSVLLDVTSITNIGILAGALWVASGAPPSARALTPAQWAIGLAAGLAMGYSSRLAFGCNVGAMVSGISTGSLHGWLWVPLAFAGTLLGIRVRRRFGFDAP